jgi:hypothetical protein
LFVAALSGVLVTAAYGQEKVRIGVLNDQTGVFATYQGLGSVVAAQMAVEDYGGKAAGKVVEVVAADHQNKPDIGVGIAGAGMKTKASMRSSTCRTRPSRSRLPPYRNRRTRCSSVPAPARCC